MPYTEKSKKATLKYRAENLERLALDLPKGKKEAWRKAAAAVGESLSGFVQKAVDDRIDGVNQDGEA